MQKETGLLSFALIGHGRGIQIEKILVEKNACDFDSALGFVTYILCLTLIILEINH